MVVSSVGKVVIKRFVGLWLYFCDSHGYTSNADGDCSVPFTAANTRFKGLPFTLGTTFAGGGR